jgi:hypothetical protein
MSNEMTIYVVLWWWCTMKDISIHSISRCFALARRSKAEIWSIRFCLLLTTSNKLIVTYPISILLWKCYLISWSRSNFYKLCSLLTGARDIVVGWGSMLLDGRSQGRFPMMSLDYLNLRNSSSSTMALSWAQPLTEMITKNLPVGYRAAGV